MVLFRHWQWFWVIFHVHHTFPYSPGQINVGDIWRLNLKHGTWGFAKKNLVLQHFRDRSMHSCECIVMKVFRPTKDEIIFHPIKILLISRSLHFFFLHCVAHPARWCQRGAERAEWTRKGWCSWRTGIEIRLKIAFKKNQSVEQSCGKHDPDKPI